MTTGSSLHQFVFGIYPYIALAVFFVGSLIRFDRDQYTWKSDSSQLLRRRELRWGSNLFHFGVLVVFFGHLFGFLIPHAIADLVMTPTQHALGAMIGGGIAGVFALVGLTLLIHRRVADPRIHANTRPWDIGKGFEESAPISALVPAAQAAIGADTRIWLDVNGTRRQDSTIGKLIWAIPEIIEHLSSGWTLAPGDLIFSGTPEGVAAVEVGDVLTMGVDGVGTLKVTMIGP